MPTPIKIKPTITGSTDSNTTGSTDSNTTGSTDSNTTGSTDSNTTGSTDSNTTGSTDSTITGSADSNTSIEATAKKLVTWMTGLIHDEHIRIDETEIQAATDLVKEPLVNDLIQYFDDPITNPATHSHSPTDYFDVLTGTKVIDGISSPPDNLQKFAHQLENDLTSDEVTNLKNYFGRTKYEGQKMHEADVIVDGLRVLNNLNVVGSLVDKDVKAVKANLQKGLYTDRKGVVEWFEYTRNPELFEPLNTRKYQGSVSGFLAFRMREEEGEQNIMVKQENLWTKGSTTPIGHSATVYAHPYGDSTRWAVYDPSLMLPGAEYDRAAGGPWGQVRLYDYDYTIAIRNTTTTNDTTIFWAA